MKIFKVNVIKGAVLFIVINLQEIYTMVGAKLFINSIFSKLPYKTILN